MHKFEKHNYVFSKLYASKWLRTVLLLDDDVLPVIIPEFNTDPIAVLQGWLERPASAPASCIYFSSKGRMTDMYYKARVGREGIKECPPKVIGWATLVRSDLGVVFDGAKVQPLVDDYWFRLQCAAEGKEVVNHMTCFFETVQKSEKESTLSEGKSLKDRVDCIKKAERETKSQFSHLFVEGRPIWKGSREVIQARVRKGLLRRGKYGYVPIPKSEKKTEKGLF